MQKSPTVQDMFQPIPGLISYAGGDREMGTAISCTEWSQVASLIQKISRGSLKASLRAAVSTCSLIPSHTYTLTRCTTLRYKLTTERGRWDNKWLVSIPNSHVNLSRTDVRRSGLDRVFHGLVYETQAQQSISAMLTLNWEEREKPRGMTSQLMIHCWHR